LVSAGVAAMGAGFAKPTRNKAELRLRPPGALDEEAFLDACARCFKCSEACPNDCIQLHSLADGFEQAFTPYIKARARGCILCGECADVCPTGALKPFTATRDGWQAGVKMGVAKVNTDMCYSYHGRTCGACYRACPLAGSAMKIGVFEKPLVQPDNCVGCGLCEQACLHLPQAIRVIPQDIVRSWG
jgi:MauM/NapG family ferredoxin protein